jgi:hypothetical protein
MKIDLAQLVCVVWVWHLTNSRLFVALDGRVVAYTCWWAVFLVCMARSCGWD